MQLLTTLDEPSEEQRASNEQYLQIVSVDGVLLGNSPLKCNAHLQRADRNIRW